MTSNMLALGAYRFRFALLPTLVTAVLLCLFVSLGAWQVNRAEEKRQILEHYMLRSQRAPTQLRLPLQDPGSWRYVNVRVKGWFDADRQFLLDNQVKQGIAGYHVLSPLRLNDTEAVLVDRGWIPAGDDRSALPDTRVTDTAVELLGYVYIPYGEAFHLGALDDSEPTWPRRVQYIDFTEMAKRLGYPLAELVLRLNPESPHGYRREWRTIPFSPERHLGYAVQWFALAAVLIVIYIALNLRRTKASPRAPHE